MGLSEQRFCDKCNKYTTCYYGSGLNQIVCTKCLLKMKGGKDWLENHQWQKEQQAKPETRTPYDRASHDFYSTAPRMSGSHRLTRDGRVVRAADYHEDD